jgi:hypothetical protein
MEKDIIKGFAKYSLNRSNQLHECTLHGVHCAQYWNMIRDGSIKEEQAKNLLATRLEVEARTAGQHISNKVARSTADSIIDATNTAKMNEAAYNRAR